MVSFIQKICKAYVEAQEQRARERVAELLDERTLRDIGLETEANRARERARLGAFRVAFY